jgi:predicted transcriptional regulator
MISLNAHGMVHVTDRSKKAFEPSMKILARISKIMLESGLIVKLPLSQKGRINYRRLNKHLDWMAKKHLIEAVLEDGKMKLRLTQKGREFAATLSK